MTGRARRIAGSISALALSGGLAAGSCGGSDVFACVSDAQCVEGGAAGYCEVDGYCSFDDDTCDSGRRYGEHALSGTANTCVPVGSPTTSVGSTGPGPTTGETTTQPPGDTTGLPVGTTDGGSTGPACTATRVRLTIAAGTVEETLTDFPVLVRASAPGLGADDASALAFTLADDPTSLPFEVERLDDSGGLLAWVRLPSVVVDGDTAFDLWVDRPDLVTGPDPAAVWDGDYLGVWHLSLADGTAVDATGQQPAGTPSDGVTPIETALGGGAAFDGVSGVITIDQSFAGSLSSFSTQIWVTFEGADVTIPFYRRLNGTSLYPRLFVNPGGSLAWQASIGGVTSFLGTPGDGLAGAPHHVAVSYDAEGGQARMYVDGEFASASQFGPGDLDGGMSSLELGSDANLDGLLLGTLDEFRVSGVVRSDAWIRASFATQSDPGSFAVAAAPETVVCP